MLNGLRIDSLSYLCMLMTFYQLKKKTIVTTEMWFSSTFEMRDIGEANYVLEIKILKNQGDFLVCLKRFTLKRFFNGLK